MREWALELVRRACDGLESWEETVKWGHARVFQSDARMFALVSDWKGELILSVKVGKDAMGVFTKDARYFPAPYLARGGWVALRLSAEMAAEEIRELVRGSYALIRPARRRRARA